MNREHATDAEAVEHRLRMLERRNRALAISLTVVVVGFTFVLVYVVRLNDRVLMTTSMFAREINVPWPQDWGHSPRANAGIATSSDGHEVSLWLAGSALSRGLHQTRIEASVKGRQQFVMYDRKGKIRLRIATTDDGEPSMMMYAPDGRILWSVPSAGTLGNSPAVTPTTNVGRQDDQRRPNSR